MTRYSEEFKQKMAARMLPPNNESVRKIAKETGVSEATLNKWKKAFRESGGELIGKKLVAEEWSSQEKFRVVLETAAMNEAELSKYCRENGLYPEEVRRWKDVCMQANGGIAEEAKRLNKDVKDREKEIRLLKKELQRKESALAETAALLVLRKKLDALLGTDEKEG